MKKRIIFIVALLGILLQMNMCRSPKGHHVITFKNNTDSAVRIPWLSGLLPPSDTIPFCDRLAVEFVEAKSTFDFMLEFKSWEESIGKGIVKFYVVDADIYDKKGCDSIVLLKHYTLTVEDLEEINWTIIYDDPKKE